MPIDYLPTREADLLQWSVNFEALIKATPTAFGLTAAQATAYTALHTDFANLYNMANSPGTRTKPVITKKNDAKSDLVDGPGGIRKLAAIIQAYPGTTDDMRNDLGLTVRDTGPTPIPAPSIAPEIDFIPSTTRTILVRMHNEKTLNRRKPEGVKGAALFYHIGATPPAAWSDWTFCENTSRQTVEVNLPAEIASGTLVWFTACWFNPRMESGPATTPTSTVVQYGGLSMAA